MHLPLNLSISFPHGFSFSDVSFLFIVRYSGIVGFFFLLKFSSLKYHLETEPPVHRNPPTLEYISGSGGLGKRMTDDLLPLISKIPPFLLSLQEKDKTHTTLYSLFLGIPFQSSEKVRSVYLYNTETLWIP